MERGVQELALGLGDVWLWGSRGDHGRVTSPKDEGQRMGTLYKEILRLADKLPQDDQDPGVRAGLQVFKELVSHGGLPELTPEEAAEWLVAGVAASVLRPREAVARHPQIDPWTSGTIRLVVDFLNLHCISHIPVDARDGVAVGSWVGSLFSEVFGAVAQSHTAGFDEILGHLAMECASAEPKPGGYVGLSSFQPKAVAAWIISMYESAVEAFKAP
jgi:hypothetical protein